MKCFIAAVVLLGVVLAVCDPTRATPVSRVRRQGWAWGDESDEEPARPPRPTQPTQPPAQATPSDNANVDPNSTTTVTPATLRACMATCPTTQQYNPVCGTNRVTYDNANKLNCARFCGVAVEMMFNGTCQPVTR